MCDSNAGDERPAAGRVSRRVDTLGRHVGDTYRRVESIRQVHVRGVRNLREGEVRMDVSRPNDGGDSVVFGNCVRGGGSRDEHAPSGALGYTAPHAGKEHGVNSLIEQMLIVATIQWWFSWRGKRPWEAVPHLHCTMAAAEVLRVIAHPVWDKTVRAITGHGYLGQIEV